ncbi:hypothetical protein M569_11025 [Genlisea aurea]|uniref:Snakin-2 n=1 Tax=Genlisea aurea TaxID=192259 RepID=S8DV29_9LAMI|nr:hypothetical protein M569_11025 [Genlisea aurea]
MAAKFVVTASFLLLLLLLSAAAAEAQLPTNATQTMDCGGACSERCRLAGRQNLCKRACGTCCLRCNCVPPGTSGNYQFCPCYAALTTRDKQRKCP